MKTITILALLYCGSKSFGMFEFEGPGGTANIEVKIVEIIDRDTAKTMGGLNIYLYPSNNYAEPLAYFHLDSTGRFNITKLPFGTFDLIIKKRGFLASKISEICLTGEHRHRVHRQAISRISSIRNKYINISIVFKNKVKEETKTEIIKHSGLDFKYRSKSKGNISLSSVPVEVSEAPEIVNYFIQSRFIKHAYVEYNSKYADDVIAIGYKPIMDINDGTWVKGSGGTCSITLEINKYRASRTPDSFYLYLYPADNYSTPVVLMLAAPNERKFGITELPEGTFDLVLKKKGFFSTKVCEIRLNASTPEFSYSMPDLSETVDITRYLTDDILITFKEKFPDSENRKNISKQNCVIKNKEGEAYLVGLTEKLSIPEAVDRFNDMPQVRLAIPIKKR